MKIEVVRDVQAENEADAAYNLRTLREHGTVAFNVLGGVGCGKTSLIEALVPRLRERYRSLEH